MIGLHPTLSRESPAAASANPRQRSALPFPPRAPLRLALRLSSALSVVSAMTGLVTVFVPRVLRDPPAFAGNARGTYVVILLVALPAMAAAMRAAARGSLRARFVWLGCVGYLLYNAVISCFALRFNELFLSYVATLSLSVWSLVAVLRCIHVPSLPLRISHRLPARALGGYLIATSVAFALLWSMDVIPAMVSGSIPASLRGTGLPTNTVQVLDFAFTLPLSMAAGVWVWRRRPWGMLLAGAMLVLLELESVSVATDQWFGHLADPTQSAAAVPLFIVLAGFGFVPLMGFVWGIRGEG